jgi:cytochrome c oxidase subunit 3
MSTATVPSAKGFFPLQGDAHETVGPMRDALLRDDRTATVALGGVFLAIKFAEYGHHFEEGIYPGGQGAFFAAHTTPGLAIFWTLYFFMTGLHAVHVTIGMILLSTTILGMRSGKITAVAPQRMEIAAIYWHLVDVIWIFLWPLLYLAP